MLSSQKNSSPPSPVLSGVRPPWTAGSRRRWISVAQFAAEYRRSRRAVQSYCNDVRMLAAFNLVAWRDPTGRWWLGLEN